MALLTGPLTKKQRLEALRAQLKNERASFEPQWRDEADHYLPTRARFTLTETNRGDRRNLKIINSTGVFASQTLSSGLMAGVTNASREWFGLTLRDRTLAQLASAKRWLHETTDTIYDAFRRSNFYDALSPLYDDFGVFGTAAIFVEEDEEDVIRCTTFPIGSYWISTDAKGRVRVFVRELRMTVRQVVEQFGKPGAEGNPDWSNISLAVRQSWERAEFETWVDVVHVITPNSGYDAEKLDSKYKRFSACYYEVGSPDGQWKHNDTYLEEKGFDEFPVFAPRWSVAGGDVYATSSPGLVALGDVKGLQIMERRKAQGIDKLVNPPMTGPVALRNEPLSVLPGGITYGEFKDAANRFQPAYQVDPKLDHLRIEMSEVERRIDRAFFADLFLMLERGVASDRRQITATEIMERKEEKLLVLGPVLGRLDKDLLAPLIDRMFAILERRGELPEAPPEIAGAELKIEYKGIMALAQRSVNLGNMERFIGFWTGVAKETERVDILDKINFDEGIDESAEMLGINPSVVVPDEDAQAIRAQRAQQQQAAERAQVANEMAGAAKQLSEADTERPSALRELLNVSRGGRQAA